MAFVAAGTASNYIDLLDDLVTFVIANGWTVRMQTEEAVSATINAGGSGYTVSDQLTLVGGNGVNAVAVFNVDSETAGAVTAVSLVTAGSYDYFPADPVATTGGTGTGCTLNLTVQPVTNVTDGPKEVTLEGIGSGSDEIFVTVKATESGSSFIWSLLGHVGFQDQVQPALQPNTSPENAFVPLNNGTITYWFFATGRRIIGVFRMGSSYTNMYLGFLNPFGTAATYPYPLMVLGCSSLSTLLFSDSTSGMGGLADPINHNATPSVLGPGLVIDPGGSWKAVRNAGGSAGSRPKSDELVVWPAGRLFSTGAMVFGDDFVPSEGSPTSVIGQTPDSTAASNFRFPLHPCIVQERTPVPQILGELDNVRWAGTLTETVGQAVSEDVYNINGDDYILFHNVNRTDHWTSSLVKRE